VARKPPVDEELLLAIEMAAVSALEDVWSRLMGETIGQYAAMQRQGLSQDEIARRIAALLPALSTKPDEAVSRNVSTVGLGEGRASALRQEAKGGGVEFAVRSAVLDPNTCPPCAALDLKVVEIGSDDFRDLKPPAKCDGRERCRCFYVGLAPAIAGGAA
jgi:hypothetical protein